MSGRLSNRTILLTRPRQQADKLADMIRAENGEAIIFPTIEIEPLADSMALRRRFANPGAYQYLIFVSRNAVTTAFQHYIREPERLGQTGVIAIGRGTAGELAAYGIQPVLPATGQADTEALLAMPELGRASLAGRAVLIIRGEGGRGLLAETLLRRGARVSHASVYRRRLPRYEKNHLQGLWQDRAIDAAVVTSNTGLENLVKLTLAEQRRYLFNTPLILMSARARRLARQQGFVSGLAIARSQDDPGLLAALLNIINPANNNMAG